MKKIIVVSAFAAVSCLIACAGTTEEEGSAPEVVAPETAPLAITRHQGYCNVDTSNKLTGYCSFPNLSGYACNTAVNSACVAGSSVADAVDFQCSSKLSKGTRCWITF